MSTELEQLRNELNELRERVTILEKYRLTLAPYTPSWVPQPFPYPAFTVTCATDSNDSNK